MVATYNVGAYQKTSYQGYKNTRKREQLARAILGDVGYFSNSLNAGFVLVQDLYDPSALWSCDGPSQLQRADPKPDKNP